MPPPLVFDKFQGRLPQVCALGLAILSYAAAGWVSSRQERRIAVGPQDGVLTYDQWSGGNDSGAKRSYQRPRRNGDLLSIDYGFQNFNGDFLTLRFTLDEKTWKAYNAGFGYRKKELAEIEDAAEEPNAQRDRKLREYLALRGFKIAGERTLAVDMPSIVRKNARLMRPAAMAIDKLAAAKRYDSENIIGAVTSLVQTAMIYRVPPLIDEGRHTGGLLPPVTALLKGWGDCDTKTGVLASILANWPGTRMVGISVPRHYLVGVLRIPAKGDLFVEHDGLQYVLIEPAGPGWIPPGAVGEETVPLLENAEGYRIEPFFAG